MIINLLRSNYEFLFYLSIFYSIYILYNKWRDLILIIKSPIKLNNNNGNWINKFLLYLAFFCFAVCFYYISNKYLGLINISNNEYRAIKLILGFSISILTLTINIKEKGFKSWRTLFSLLSLCLLLFYATLLFDEEWKNLFYEKLNSYIIKCSFLICILFSLFSHEYLYVSGIDISNNLKAKLLKIQKSELINNPDTMKIEDLLNKEDSIQIKNNDLRGSSNIPFNKIKAEDLLNKEDSNNSNKDQNTNRKTTNEIFPSNRKEKSDNIIINNLSESNKNKNTSQLVSKNNANNDISVRPTTSDSISSASVKSYDSTISNSSDKSHDSRISNGSDKSHDSTISNGSDKSHDSTISNAHICIVQGTNQLINAAESFTNQWKEGKIFDENAKEKKEMLDEIIDLPDEQVFKILKYRGKWERDNAMARYIEKRNMPLVPEEKLIKMANAGFNETMSNKEEKQKFWNRLKAYVKEPIKKKDFWFDKFKKETLNEYRKGEEEAITIGKDKKKALELGGRKLKRGGLTAVYENKKIDVEVAIQQDEIRAVNMGREVKHNILPSFGRLSIFELMNQSVLSVINDYKKLNLDSSNLDNTNKEIKTNSTESQPIIKNDTKVNVNDSSIIDDNNLDKGKSILIKGENNEINKKRRIN
jgi:hypothetical protein